MRAPDVLAGFLFRARRCAATQSIQDAAFLLEPRRDTLPAQSFQLPFELLQLRDPRRDMRNVLIQKPMCRVAIFSRHIAYPQ